VRAGGGSSSDDEPSQVNDETASISKATENSSASCSHSDTDRSNISNTKLRVVLRIKTESIERANVPPLVPGTTRSMGAKVRATLGQVMYRIRFPTMQPGMFASHFGQSDVLSGDEKCAIYYHLITHGNGLSDSFQVN